MGLRRPSILASVGGIRAEHDPALAADRSLMIHALPLYQFRQFFKN
jgi:hypothetical protein